MIIDNFLFSIGEEKFIIEDVDDDNKLTKKFRSKAKDHVRIFKWDFGDNSPILETDNRTIYHTFPSPGTYIVKHQACSFSWCCSEWCTKHIKIRRKEEEEDHKEREERHMSNSFYLSPPPEFVIISPEFSVEDIPLDEVQSLNSTFRKRFTSSASPLATVFKWDFGDTSPILVTHDRSIEHEYHNAGFYIVRHQACFFDAPCCYTNDLQWCEKEIKVLPPEAAAPAWLGVIGVGGFLLLAAKRECEDYNNKKDCEDVRLYYKDKKPYCKVAKDSKQLKLSKEKLLNEPCCEWIETEKEKRCLPRCKKGFERKLRKGKSYCTKIKIK